MDLPASFLPRWELDGVRGAVVVIDVIRAFTTAAYAFAAGAEAIYLVGTIDQALAFVAQNPEARAMGELHGKRPDGFAYSNSPAAISRVDLGGRTLVQRTSAGTQGVLSAKDADRLWCASLVCATATARVVDRAGLGAPTYVITGRFPDAPDSGDEDLVCAEHIERVRLGQPVDDGATAHLVLTSEEAAFTLALGPEHTDPEDIAYATRIDAFDFAMEATRTPRGICLQAVR